MKWTACVFTMRFKERWSKPADDQQRQAFKTAAVQQKLFIHSSQPQSLEKDQLKAHSSITVL